MTFPGAFREASTISPLGMRAALDVGVVLHHHPYILKLVTTNAATASIFLFFFNITARSSASSIFLMIFPPNLILQNKKPACAYRPAQSYHIACRGWTDFLIFTDYLTTILTSFPGTAITLITFFPSISN